MAAAASPQLIGAEFNRLTSSATALLEELREYPAYGRLWESHFHRTFDHFMRVCFLLHLTSFFLFPVLSLKVSFKENQREREKKLKSNITHNDQSRVPLNFLSLDC